MFGDDLDALPGVLRLGRATRRTILANIAASVSTKVFTTPTVEAAYEVSYYVRKVCHDMSQQRPRKH